MKRLVVTILMLCSCGTIAPHAETAPGGTITLQHEVPAYSVNAPHDQRGLFPAGGVLTVVSTAENGMLRVRFTSPSGRTVEALCRTADIESPAPTPATSIAAAPASRPAAAAAGGRFIPGAVYENREWLEDAEGHRQALEFQTKYDVPMLIFFYAEWNDECTHLWENLLSTSDFKAQSKNIIKLRINPEHGKPEGLLANKYRLRRYPTTMVIDKPNAKPRYLEMVSWSFGKLRTVAPDYAMLDIMGGVTNQKPWQKSGDQPPTPEN